MKCVIFFRSLQCINLLKLPPDLARDVASILISAEKLDKDFKKAVSKIMSCVMAD